MYFEAEPAFGSASFLSDPKMEVGSKYFALCYFTKKIITVKRYLNIM